VWSATANNITINMRKGERGNKREREENKEK
jgi:hypothetical protein